MSFLITGVFVEDEKALDCFESGGARVDRKTKMVQIPPYLVEEAIRSAPSKVILAGRDSKHDLILEGNRVHFTNFSEGVKVNDLQTGENRTPVKKDLVNSARNIDYLDEVDFCEKALGAHDVSQKTVPLHNAEAYLTNTTKHCAFGPGNRTDTSIGRYQYDLRSGDARKRYHLRFWSTGFRL
jgi:trimethylamine--corrinoid protein Co-methyltransferase